MRKIIKKTTNKEQGKKILRQAEPAQCFWVCDGAILKDLRELAAALETMSVSVFNYHVNAAKNDFARWIGEVLGESRLMKDIAQIKTAKAMAKKVRTYL